jgi:putative ABC transport system permease protein
MRPTQIWIMASAARRLDVRGSDGALPGDHSVTIIGRIAPDRDVDAVAAEFQALGRRLDASGPVPIGAGAAPRVWSAWTQADEIAKGRAASSKGKAAVLVVIGLVLVVASTNLANLFMARGASREAERALRRALGASRSRIFAESLTETGLIALSGGAAAIVVTQIVLLACTRYMSYGMRSFYLAPHWTRSVWDAEGLLVAVSFFCFGVLPAWRLSRPSARSTPNRRPSRLRGRWISGQVAVASSLLLVSTMCLRELQQERQHDAGVDYSRVDVARFSFNEPAWSQPRIDRTERAILDELRRHPEFDTAAMASTLPFGMHLSRAVQMTPTDHPFQTETAKPANVTALEIDTMPGMFRALDVSIINGRALTDDDHPGPQPNIVIGERAARRLFGSVDVVNRSVLLRGDLAIADRSVVTATVVGVAEATDSEDLFGTSKDAVYMPFGQYPSTRAVVVARTSDPVRNAGLFQHAIRAAEPDVLVEGSGTGEEMLTGPYVALAPFAELTSSLGLTAMLLAMCGLYGVLLDVVTQRLPEMGVRLTLGADASQLIRVVVSQGLRPVLLGIPVGLSIAIVARKFLQVDRVLTSELFDPLALLYASLPFILAAVWACYWPARRASRVDPTIVLRAE